MLTGASDTRHTWSGDFSIAYQVIGDGPPDLLYLPQFLSNRGVELAGAGTRPVHEAPGCVLPADRHAPSRGRMFGPVAAGSGGPRSRSRCTTSSPSCPRRRRSATILAGERSAFVAMVTTATHPERLDGLVLFGATPSWMRSDELPWQDPPEELERVLEQMRTSASMQEWARVWARRFAPSLSEDGIASLAS